MQRRVGEILFHYAEHGRGAPILALHGAGVDHRELEAALEPVVPAEGYHRIYPDLPGMGRTTASGLTSNDDVVRTLCEFVDDLRAGPVLLVGHSYGAYLARGVAARRPDLVRGLALLCPVAGQSRDLPTHEVVRQDADAYDELPPELRQGFDEYFVVRTASTARRHRDAVAPGMSLVDETALEQIFGGWPIDLGSGPFTAPTLIVAARGDATAGYADAADLLESYPHATLAVVADAGHAVAHERPGIVAALLADWLGRALAPVR